MWVLLEATFYGQIGGDGGEGYNRPGDYRKLGLTYEEEENLEKKNASGSVPS